MWVVQNGVGMGRARESVWVIAGLLGFLCNCWNEQVVKLGHDFAVAFVWSGIGRGATEGSFSRLRSGDRGQLGGLPLLRPFQSTNRRAGRSPGCAAKRRAGGRRSMRGRARISRLDFSSFFSL